MKEVGIFNELTKEGTIVIIGYVDLENTKLCKGKKLRIEFVDGTVFPSKEIVQDINFKNLQNDKGSSSDIEIKTDNHTYLIKIAENFELI